MLDTKKQLFNTCLISYLIFVTGREEPIAHHESLVEIGKFFWFTQSFQFAKNKTNRDFQLIVVNSMKTIYIYISSKLYIYLSHFFFFWKIFSIPLIGTSVLIDLKLFRVYLGVIQLPCFTSSSFIRHFKSFLRNSCDM